MRCVERLSQAEAVSWNFEAGAGGQEEAAGETMVRDICHAWLHSPSPTMGPGDQPVVAFFSVPSFPGTLMSLTMSLLSPARFLPTFNPSSLLLFLPLVSVSTRKQNAAEMATIHSPPSASVLHHDFCLLLWLRPVLVARMCTKFFSRRPLPLPCALAETNVRPPEDGGDSSSRWCTNRNKIKASQSGALLVPPQI